MMRNANSQTPEREAALNLSTAMSAEYDKDFNKAFRLYIKSAENFLHLSRISSATEKSRQEWKNSAATALARAESIKSTVNAARTAKNVPSYIAQPPSPHLQLTPVGINHFSDQEQFYILKKGGSVNGLFFGQWDEPVHISNGTSLYEDPDGQPKLSPDQDKVSPVWKRLSCGLLPDSSYPRRRILPQEILQHTVTDCSVCASISVCLEHGRKFGSTLAESCIHEFSSLQGTVKLSTDKMRGRYDVRILLNGAWRRVLIDDRLPFHPTEGTLMCMSILPTPSTSTPGVTSINTLWPSLLEKAYMKIMGGYDFPGSNSSIDLHALVGWVPEHIETKRSSFEREKTWERIQRGFTTGQCMVTLGTGSNPYVQWRDVPLLPSHSYAVIDVYETVEGRFFTVLDSWVRTAGEQNQPSKIIQIPWSEVLNTFDGVYLSWDPSIWKGRLTFHGMWKRNEGDDDGMRHIQMEFCNNSDLEEEVWILLTRHVVDTQRTSDFVALQVEVEDLLLNGDIQEIQQSLSSKGTYTNSTQILSRTRVSPTQRSGILSILSSYEGVAREVGFTLTAYATERVKISWIEGMSTPSYTQKVEGSLSSKNAGGNCTYPSFMVNPQYQLVIHPKNARSEKAKVSLTLQSSKDMPVNVSMVWSQGQRVSEFSEKDLAATSGAYSYGSARVTKLISPGEYTIVASAFEPHHMGSFALKVESSNPFDMKPIPQEGAGMYCKVVRGSWEGQTAAGAPSFNKYTKNPIFELNIPSATQMKIRLQLLHPSTAISLNVTVYPNSHDDVASSVLQLQKRHVMTSGAYDDAIAGVATPQVTLSAGKYFVVPSTYNPATEAGFRIMVYTNVLGVKLTPLDGHSR